MDELRVLEAGSKLPSVAPLDQVILSWDFYRDVHDDKDSTAAAEQSRILLPGSRLKFSIADVPTIFDTEEDYVRTFFPLFLLETKQAINQRKTEELGKPEIMTQGHVEPKGENFIITLQRVREVATAIRYQTSDLILLYFSQPEDANSEKTESNKKVGSSDDVDEERGALTSPKDDNENHVLAIVESSFQSTLTVKVFIPNKISKTDDLRRWNRVNSVAKAIGTDGFRWTVAKVTPLTTMHREFQALMSFPDMLLKDYLLNEDLIGGPML
eukprot:Selendium_serpulae@DN7162_c0_g1_i1.p1